MVHSLGMFYEGCFEINGSTPEVMLFNSQNPSENIHSRWSINELCFFANDQALIATSEKELQQSTDDFACENNMKISA